MKKNTELKKAGVAEIRLTYFPSRDLIKQPKIRTSKDAFELFREKWEPGLIEFVEEFKVMLLSIANNVIGIVDVSKGTVCSTIVDPKIVIAAAINSNSCSIILCHNHPSGNLQPSKADQDITNKIREAAKFFDLKVMDHLVISKISYFSFAEAGLC